MRSFEEPRRVVDLAEPASSNLVDTRALGVFAYDTHDVMGAGDTVRVLVAARSARQAAHWIRRAGFRVRRWTPPVARVPYAEAARALGAPGVVVWRNHDPDLAEQWFHLPH